MKAISRRDFIKASKAVAGMMVLYPEKRIGADTIASDSRVPNDWRKHLPEPVLGVHRRWIDLYYDTWRIARERMREYEGRTVLDTAFDPGRIWLWDTVWISFFGIYAQGAIPAITNPMHGYDLFYKAQRKDGAIPHVWSEDGKHDYDVHNPIFSMGELNYYRHTGGVERLKPALKKLDRFFDFLKGKYASGEAGLFRGFDWNNGMDNRPTSYFSIDTNCEQAMVAAQLGKLAAIVHEDGLVTKYEKEHKTLEASINDRMWSSPDRFYTDCDKELNPVNVWSVASFWALLSKVAGIERARHLKEHLMDPDNFKRPFMVPTLGRKSRWYDGNGGNYWRGAVWVPTNVMVIKGLVEYGYLKEAREIAINGLEGICKTWENTGTLHENYDQEVPGRPGEKSKADFVGWSGTQPIATLIEDVIGILPNAPENRISWKLGLIEKNGIRRLKWGRNYSKEVDLIAEARTHPDAPAVLHVRTNSPFLLDVHCGSRKKTIDIREPGRYTVTV